MPKDLFEGKGNKSKNPRDLFENHPSMQLDSNNSAIDMHAPILDAEPMQQQSNSPLIESLIQRFPQLAEKFANMQMPEGVRKAGELAGKFNNAFESTGIPSFAGGLLQGAGNSAISAANVPLGLAGAHIPHLDLKQFNQPGLVNDLGFGAGDIGGQIAGFFGGSGLLGKAGSALGLARPAGYAGLASDIAVPAAAAALTGENAEGGGRMLAGILGGLGGAVGSLRNANIAKNITSDAGQASKEGSALYTKLFNQAETQGLKIDKLPKIEIEKIKKGMPKSFSRSLQELPNNPSLENVQSAISDIGKWTRKVEPTINRGAATSTTIKAYDAALEAQKKLRGSLYKALSENGTKQALPKAYEEATINWAKEVAPFKSNKALQNFSNGKITSEELTAKLLKDNEFMQRFGKDYPQLKIKQNIKKAAPYLATGAAAAGSYAGIDKLIKALKGDK